ILRFSRLTPSGRDRSGEGEPDLCTLHVSRDPVAHSNPRSIPGDRRSGIGEGQDINAIRAWLRHVSIDTTNVYAEVDLETKAQMLAACGSFTAGKTPARRWRDDRPLMQFLRNL